MWGLAWNSKEHSYKAYLHHELIQTLDKNGSKSEPWGYERTVCRKPKSGPPNGDINFTEQILIVSRDKKEGMAYLGPSALTLNCQRNKSPTHGGKVDSRGTSLSHKGRDGSIFKEFDLEEEIRSHVQAVRSTHI